jgi:hypothetical protein
MSVVAAVADGRIVAWLLFGVAALTVDVAAARRLWRAGVERFRFGRWSKAGWLVATFGITWHLGVLDLPVGALLAFSRTWTQRAAPDPGQVPFAEGDGWPEGWS